MSEATLVALLLGFPLLGFLARRWVAVLPPLVGWPLFYVGLDNGSWLYGTGDGWEQVAVALIAVDVATTALAVALGRSLRRRGEVSRHGVGGDDGSSRPV